MITFETKMTEQFKPKNKSLPASPDKDNVLESTNKSLKDSLVNNVTKSEATSKTNSLFGSDVNINIESLSRVSDEGSTDDSEFDGLIYKDSNNSLNTLYMLNVLRKNRQLCDLILQLDNDSQDIYCHQLILACNSKFFMEIFNNYEAENSSKQSTEANESRPETPKIKNSLIDFVTRNHGANNRQIVFCLSSYLKNFLSNSHHHYAKINSIIHHNNHQYLKTHSSNHNIEMTQPTNDDETINHINQNLDYQALRICIDYMYTSKLKVPSHLLPHVYTLAFHLSIENIVQVCAQYLSRLLNVDNCLSIRSFALDENLIAASSECIEKNIEYILNLKPLTSLSSRGSISSSMNSLFSNSNHKINGLNTLTPDNNIDLTKATLSSSLNLAHKEFNQLPRIQIELVGLRSQKFKLPDGISTLTDLCMNWLIDEIHEKKRELLELSEDLNMLYLYSDTVLHDCYEMDSTDENYDDNIDDYKKRNKHLGAKNNQNGLNKRKCKKDMMTPSPATGNRLKTFTITDQELNNIGTATPIKFKTLHDNEVICSHQTSENSFITICILSSNLVTLSVHVPNKKQQEISSEVKILNEQATNDNETKERNLSVKSDTLTELNSSLNEPSNTAQFSLDSNLNNHKPPTIMFNRSLSTNSSFDPEKIPRMNLARCSHGVIPYENRLYIIGGYDRGECLNLCEVYDPNTNTLTDMEPMINKRGRAAISFNSKEKNIYVMGGSDGHQDLNSIEHYNMTTKKWHCKTFDFELSCSNLASTSCYDFIYLVGLRSEGKKTLKHTSCLKYEPKSNSFTRLSELNHGRSQGVLVYTSIKTEKNECDLLFVFGGHDQIRCLNSCEVYNISEDKWTVIESMHVSKRGCGAAVHKASNSIFVVGGTNGAKCLKTVEIYNIVTQKWTVGPELNIARNNVSVAFLGNNLFAVGGYDGKSFLRTIEYLNVNNLDAGWSLFHKPQDFNRE